jgi:geranylgeranyl diphosphate synthase type II
LSYPDDLREAVDRHLESVRFSGEAATAGLEDAMRYSLLAGGKRIRPVLCLATARSLGRPIEEYLDIAAALEMVHTYSLVHDDLPAMDDDDLRRGQPTSHIRFGEAVAILAGDGLFAEAMRTLAAVPGEPERVLETVKLVAGATGVAGMVGGQYVDVTAEELDADELLRLHSLKTGRLIEVSVESALSYGGVPAAGRAPYELFARELGVLFQIVDDILDVTGSDEALGKPQGSDERHGKVTYVSLYGLERARELAAGSHGAAIAALDQVEGETRSLRSVADYIYRRET